MGASDLVRTGFQAAVSPLSAQDPELKALQDCLVTEQTLVLDLAG